MPRRVLLAAAALLLAAPALATDQDTLAKAAGKYLTPPGKPASRGLCVCLADDFLGVKRVGVLQLTFLAEASAWVGVICTIPGFDSTTGQFTGSSDCANWTTLSK